MSVNYLGNSDCSSYGFTQCTGTFLETHALYKLYKGMYVCMYVCI